MKNKGHHPEKALSAARVRTIREHGRHADGNGLYLVVDRSGAKRWVLRTVVHGKRRDIGLGGLSTVSLAEARETATTLRKIARTGGDPLAERRKAQAYVPTFEETARKVHAEYSVNWKNPKHIAQWINTLEKYAFPVFGDRRVDQIGTPEVLKALSPIWHTKPETARRVRQRIGTVMDRAKVAGFRTGDNPIDGISKGLGNQPTRKVHHAALPYPEVHGFIDELRNTDGSESARLAFEFLILTATRTSETLLAEWSEINVESRTWTISSERMKTNLEYRVPLSSRCLEIMGRAKELSDGSDYLFHGQSTGKPLSNMVFLMMIRRMGMGKKITAHGFRSSFRDWAAERTNFSREVCEKALAHTIRDHTEAAYRRGDLFDKRRDLMETWAADATHDSKADVVTLRSRKA